MKQITAILATLIVVLTAAWIGYFTTVSKTDKSISEADVESVQHDKDSLALAMHLIYHTKPERVADFKKAFDKCAAETRKEPGCTAYALYQSYNDSTEFFLYEGWVNRAAHKAHMGTEHLKVYFGEIDGVFDESRPVTANVVQVVP